MKKKEIIYTSLDEFKPKNPMRYEVKNYKELDPSFVRWIDKARDTLLKKRRTPELIMGKKLRKYIPGIPKQVFFRIHGRCYFLDYYYPQKKIAIEVDGAYHRERKEIDKQRDNDFADIGIKTIRIRNKRVYKGHYTLEYIIFLKGLALDRLRDNTKMSSWQKGIRRKELKREIHQLTTELEISRRNSALTNNHKICKNFMDLF